MQCNVVMFKLAREYRRGVSSQYKLNDPEWGIRVPNAAQRHTKKKRNIRTTKRTDKERGEDDDDERGPRTHSADWAKDRSKERGAEVRRSFKGADLKEITDSRDPCAEEEYPRAGMW